jgi:hypothetical protein
MRQAIQTKFLGPTNFRGSRVKATASAGSITIAWNHALGIEGNHLAAARAFAQKFGWSGEWFGGGIETGYVFVNADSYPSADFVVAIEAPTVAA